MKRAYRSPILHGAVLLLLGAVLLLASIGPFNGAWTNSHPPTCPADSEDCLLVIVLGPERSTTVWILLGLAFAVPGAVLVALGARLARRGSAPPERTLSRS